MKTTPCRLMVGLSLLAVVSAGAFASDPTPVSPSSSTSSPISQEISRSFVYQPKSDQPDPAPLVAPTIAYDTEMANTAKSTPVTMESVKVKDSPERQFRAVSDAMAFSNPTAARALITKDLHHNLQFEALCGPIFPTLGENAIHGEQPRFPLVGLNW